MAFKESPCARSFRMSRECKGPGVGTQAVVFPSHHGGFVSGESGWNGEPEAFAVTLRKVLAER
jgi:hypothetical protein